MLAAITAARLAVVLTDLAAAGGIAHSTVFRAALTDGGAGAVVPMAALSVELGMRVSHAPCLNARGQNASSAQSSAARLGRAPDR